CCHPFRAKRGRPAAFRRRCVLEPAAKWESCAIAARRGHPPRSHDAVNGLNRKCNAADKAPEQQWSTSMLADIFILRVEATARAAKEAAALKYQGSVHDYGRTQTYTDRIGQFTGSAINNGNGTTSFFNRNGNFTGPAGSSIDRAFNFGRAR